MLKISDLFDMDLYGRMLKEGYVKMQSHDTANLRILNYTPSTQYERMWNEVTKQCRGLIFNPDTLEVKARPFEKFFNYGEVADQLPNERYEVLDKLDGSLGIAYHDGSSWAIATRGSFMSEQAVHATDVLRRKYPDFTPAAGFTYLFEIIYPSNRIVVDYQGQDDLVLIDVIHNDTGQSFLDYMELTWPGERVKTFPYETLEECLLSQRENREGFVIKYESGMRVKVKHDEYVRLHRIVTNVNAKTVWRYLSEGKDLAEIIDNVPDEFYDWVHATIKDLNNQYFNIMKLATLSYVRVMKATLLEFIRDREIPEADFRRRFAINCAKPDLVPQDLRSLMFLQLDKRPIDEAIWKRIQPTATRPFLRQSEDAN